MRSRQEGTISPVVVLVLLIGAGLLVLALTLFRDQPPDATSEIAVEPNHAAPGTSRATPVQVMKPQRRDIAMTITLPANISPWQQATLYAKVPGYLKWMGVDKGDTVKKGQLLAVIDAPEVEQQFRQAEADYRIKQLTFQRLHNVWKENPDVIAKQDVDVAAAEAEGAKHVMENHRTLLDYTKVEAPFAGVITARFADPGALIQSGSISATQTVPLYTLMDLDTVRVYISVPQEVALLAKPGLPVTLARREAPGQDVRGSITRTTEALDPATRTLLVEVDMPNQDRQLQPGMYVTATLYLERHANALGIPPAAIATGANKELAVFAVDQGTARRIPIKTGLDDGQWVEVTAGLTGNEDIVVVGKSSLKDGQAVAPSPYNLPSGKPASQKY